MDIITGLRISGVICHANAPNHRVASLEHKRNGKQELVLASLGIVDVNSMSKERTMGMVVTYLKRIIGKLVYFSVRVRSKIDYERIVYEWEMYQFTSSRHHYNIPREES